MPQGPVSAAREPRTERIPPYDEEAECGVLGSILLDSSEVLDKCHVEQLSTESFWVPAHRIIYEAMVLLGHEGRPVDTVTLSARLRDVQQLDNIGGSVVLDRLVDATPTAAHAEYYIDIVRQKHLLRRIIDCARKATQDCYNSDESADQILSTAEQAFLDITENQHGRVEAWDDVVKATMGHVETILNDHRGLMGVATGFDNLDRKLQGLRSSEMIVLAARPSMGKTSLAMNIAENVALGVKDPSRTARPVGVFSLEMSSESLAMRMLCSHAGVSAFRLTSGCMSSTGPEHQSLTKAASVLSKAQILLDDTGGLDVMELRARARRMKKKHDVELIVIDYLQLLHSREHARQGRQIETSAISGNIKSMAKELKIPVIVLSQLSRAPEQRDKSSGRPKLSDLRDSGAIEQDADVVCMLRRPCKYPDDPDHEDDTLAIVDVAKHRNGPTGEVQLNFEEEYTRFRDRAYGVDAMDEEIPYGEEDEL